MGAELKAQPDRDLLKVLIARFIEVQLHMGRCIIEYMGKDAQVFNIDYLCTEVEPFDSDFVAYFKSQHKHFKY